MIAAGVTWIAAAAFAIAMTIAFRTDSVQVVVTIVIGVVAAALGLWLMARPSAPAVSASNVAAVAWTVLYGALALQQFGELAAWTTDVALIAIGVAAGIAAHRATKRASA